MARTQTLLSLRTQARQRADRENSTFVSDTEVNEFVNQSWATAYEIISESGEEYYLANPPQTITTASGIAGYALPATHYKTRGVDVLFNGTTISARRFNFAERNLYGTLGYYIFGEPLAYLVQGQQLVFLPIPGGTYTVTHWYYPAPARLVMDTDTLDGVAGWEEFAVLDAALKILEKEGKSGQPNGIAMKGKRDEELQRIRSMSSSRDEGAPPRVARTRFIRRTSPRWR